MFDTIVAPITGAPPAAVAWVRLSGPDAWRIAGELFAPWPNPVEPRRALYGHWRHGDDGLALPFSSNASYTGEEAVEISLHGSHASLLSAVEACLAAGARMARPGEFTERAFLSGRIDLTQAEAVRETIDALTEAQLAEANRNRDGALRQAVERLRKVALRVRAAVEASVDFSEEIGDLDTEEARRNLVEMATDLGRLLGTAHVGRILRQGLRIAIVGPPNAGKSSLLNALLGTERAIVTPVPGTTRDYVEEAADFGGLPVVLIDTAGLRETDDPVEAIGVQRSKAQAAGADVIWFVYDGSEEAPEPPTFGRPVVLVANKADLRPGAVGIPVSAVNGAGLPELIASVGPFFDRPPGPTVSPRVADLLRRAAEEVDSCLAHLQADVPDDLLSVLLSEVATTLGEITGETASPDMVAQIFHDFCVGK
ncbi:MAG: tRNA uridine-5-carboxymethylaminomethyl(34) synthesis GTPase MnmE [Fimbriimonas sp.]